MTAPTDEQYSALLRQIRGAAQATGFAEVVLTGADCRVLLTVLERNTDWHAAWYEKADQERLRALHARLDEIGAPMVPPNLVESLLCAHYPACGCLRFCARCAPSVPHGTSEKLR